MPWNFRGVTVLLSNRYFPLLVYLLTFHYEIVYVLFVYMHTLSARIMVRLKRMVAGLDAPNPLTASVGFLRIPMLMLRQAIQGMGITNSHCPQCRYFVFVRISKKYVSRYFSTLHLFPWSWVSETRSSITSALYLCAVRWSCEDRCQSQGTACRGIFGRWKLPRYFFWK